MEKILIAFGMIFLNTVGQLFLKKAALIGSIRNPYLWSGYALFATTVIVSYFLMQYIGLLYFTVIMSLNYLTVLYASAFFFDEYLTRNKIIGTLLVLFGVIIFIGGGS